MALAPHLQGLRSIEYETASLTANLVTSAEPRRLKSITIFVNIVHTECNEFITPILETKFH